MQVGKAVEIIHAEPLVLPPPLEEQKQPPPKESVPVTEPKEAPDAVPV